MSETYFNGGQVIERVVLFGTSSYLIIASGGTETKTIAHGLAKRPFIDGQVSKDQITWYPISTIRGTGEMISAYTDSTNVYFSIYAGVAGTTFYFRYTLFFLESA